MSASVQTQPQVRVRPVRPSDRLAIQNLVRFEPYVHRHLGWRSPIEWMGFSPFLVLERNQRPTATLICPPDPADVAWIRAFAAAAGFPARRAWEMLWDSAREMLAGSKTRYVTALCTHGWFAGYLQQSRFASPCSVVMQRWQNHRRPLSMPAFRGMIRPITQADLAQILQLDRAAFDPIWQLSNSTLEMAWKKSAFATMVPGANGPLGYQLSTPSPLGGHLARLAIDPAHQGQGIGFALLTDLLQKFQERGALEVTVNTQDDNQASLSLYKKSGFELTGERFPVYQYDL